MAGRAVRSALTKGVALLAAACSFIPRKHLTKRHPQRWSRSWARATCAGPTVSSFPRPHPCSPDRRACSLAPSYPSRASKWTLTRRWRTAHAASLPPVHSVSAPMQASSLKDARPRPGGSAPAECERTDAARVRAVDSHGDRFLLTGNKAEFK